jgi:hypothetical protein
VDEAVDHMVVVLAEVDHPVVEVEEAEEVNREV